MQKYLHISQDLYVFYYVWMLKLDKEGWLGGKWFIWRMMLEESSIDTLDHQKDE